MPVAGNHERWYNYSHYTQRFRGIENKDGSTVNTDSGPAPNNWWYSVNIGLVHFVVINSDIYFTWNGMDYTNDIKPQWDWLRNDLEIANQNRDKQPWIIAMCICVYIFRQYCHVAILNTKNNCISTQIYSNIFFWGNSCENYQNKHLKTCLLYYLL